MSRFWYHFSGALLLAYYLIAVAAFFALVAMAWHCRQYFVRPALIVLSALVALLQPIWTALLAIASIPFVFRRGDWAYFVSKLRRERSHLDAASTADTSLDPRTS